jgi:hypothetical protein
LFTAYLGASTIGFISIRFYLSQPRIDYVRLEPYSITPERIKQYEKDIAEGKAEAFIKLVTLAAQMLI